MKIKVINRMLIAGWFLFRFFLPALGSDQSHPEFSRLFIYDIRGQDSEETAILLEQKGEGVEVWFHDYLGKRIGEMPYPEYLAAFLAMRQIREFALKKEYQGHFLRAHAARGTITLAWKDHEGKQIKTIRYYAPEHTLDDFRTVFNRIWALSRYAILSLNSFENPKLEYCEDALYFLSGAGWMTQQEIQAVIHFHQQRGYSQRLAAAIWSALDQKYSASSEFSHSQYLEYCVTKGMLSLGTEIEPYLKIQAEPSKKHSPLAQKILPLLKSSP